MVLVGQVDLELLTLIAKSDRPGIGRAVDVVGEHYRHSLSHMRNRPGSPPSLSKGRRPMMPPALRQASLSAAERLFIEPAKVIMWA